MTKQLLLLIALTLYVWLIQAQDNSWIIVNNQFSHPINGSQDIRGSGNIYNLENIKYPNRSCVDSANDDLFIIYEDGTYFNSRNHRTNRDPEHLTFEYHTSTNNNGDMANLYLNTGKQSISYMSLTEVYDHNGRPQTVSRSAGSQNDEYINNISDAELFHGVSPEILSSSRVAVPGRDVTLVVRLDSLDPSKVYRLAVDSIIYDNTHHIFQNTSTPSDVFAGTSVMGHAETRFTDLDALYFSPYSSDNKYLYVNYEINSSLNEVVSENPTGLKIIFNLESIDISTDDESLSVQKPEMIKAATRTPRAALLEDLRDAHDPNRIVSTNICKNDAIQYDISFHNDQDIEANNLRCEITFPSSFDIKNVCLRYAKYEDSNTEIIENLFLENNTVFIIFDENCSIMGCRKPINVELGLDIQLQSANDIHNISLAPTSAYTIFNTDSNPKRYELDYQDHTCQFSFQRSEYIISVQQMHADINSTSIRRNPTTIIECMRTKKNCETCIKKPWYKLWSIRIAAAVAAIVAFLFVK